MTAALDVTKLTVLVLRLYVGGAIVMCELSCCVYVICVFLVGHGVARDFLREAGEHVQFTSATRLRRHAHSSHSPENHHTTSHREAETRRHEQHSSGNDFKHHEDHQTNQNYLDHSDSRDRFRPVTTMARQNSDIDRHEHYSNEFNRQPTQIHESFNKHKVFNHNQQENYERPLHGHDIDFNRQDERHLPSGRHDQDRRTGQYNSDSHHDHREKDSGILERPELHGQQFEENPGSLHRQPSHTENEHKTHHQNLPSNRYNQDRQRDRHHSDNQHHDHRGQDSTMVEQSRGVHHSQQFEDNPIDHHRKAGHSEHQHKTQHRDVWNNRGGEQHHSYYNNEQIHATEHNHLNLNNTERHEIHREKDVKNEEVVTERISEKQLSQEEIVQLSSSSTSDRKNAGSHKTSTGSQLETNYQHTTTTPASSTTPTVATTHKSNTTHLPHLTSVVVLAAPDRACADGMVKDFTRTCRPVYQTDKT